MSIGEQGRIPGDLRLAYLVPNRKDPRALGVLQSEQRAKFGLRPALFEEGAAHDHDAEPAAGEPYIDSCSKAVSDAELQLVEPHAESRADELVRESARDRLVLRCMTDEELPLWLHCAILHWRDVACAVGS